MNMKLEFNMRLKNELSHKDTYAIAKCLGDFGSTEDYINFENNSIVFKMTKNQNKKYLSKLFSCLEQFLLDSDVMKIGSIEENDKGIVMNIYAFKGRIFSSIEDIQNEELIYKIFDVNWNQYSYSMSRSECVPVENHIAATYFSHFHK